MGDRVEVPDEQKRNEKRERYGDSPLGVIGTISIRQLFSPLYTLCKEWVTACIRLPKSGDRVEVPDEQKRNEKRERYGDSPLGVIGTISIRQLFSPLYTLCKEWVTACTFALQSDTLPLGPSIKTFSGAAPWELEQRRRR
jgi:hypothetical protein